ncbi:U3 small nucleolar ribonucleoprotein complex, subunit Mpp10 [Desarmillaria tabescens]|uniref:U3 small nucleolar ribonucleoprotein protein MPP10 n=1 Tax=Armillaria tabescens TaxID=1929756 RepID=A0AA39NGC9_ARMTA|nr:U3 small nucleolar ribonucleoprotein complex, subunit Mpp10 [Desarmillaria tabescens]KAK0465145.1 U3 small nucleolar ribonucleoprotein complex, subunit Mpp10 [Desarmillaria tabescens]
MTEVEDAIIPAIQRLSDLVDNQPENYARGSQDIQLAALAATQYIFDLSLKCENVSAPHINSLLQTLSPSEAPQTRSQSKKRKRSPSPPRTVPTFEMTPLTSLFTDGMDEEQIWAQLDLRASRVTTVLEQAIHPDEDSEDEDKDETMQKVLEALRNGEDVEGFDFDDLDEDLGESDEGALSESSSEEEEEEEEESSEEEPHEEGVMTLKDPSSEEDSSAEDFSDSQQSPRRRKAKKSAKKSRPEHSELDDDFFNLKSFNSQTERSEARSVSRGNLDADGESSDEEFVDLFAPVDVENFDEEDLEDSAEPFYKDFFAPPRSGASKRQKGETRKDGVRFHDEVRVKKIKAKGKNLPLSLMFNAGEDEDEDEDEDDEDDGLMEALQYDEDEGEGVLDDSNEDKDEEDGDEDMDTEDGTSEHSGGDAIDRLKDDLFAEEDEEPERDQSQHEKRMAALKEQIVALEEENVGQKDWVLMGEAHSRSRPQNSLLEEDLEFERVMKALPVITEEVVQELEERIKARIMDNNFDDVVRIRPLDDKPFLPSRFFELKDTKSADSLAQIYENEFVAAQTGGPVDDRDGKLKKEHDDIEKLWDNICAKLDALCNAHFTPKQAKATISSISNIATTSLESALPTTESTATMLAPEEVFAPSPSDLRSRSEMTPSEKQALRAKERKARKKRRDQLNTAVDKYARTKGSVKSQKKDALEMAVKSGKGVTVVGKQRKDILQRKDSRKSK